MNRQMSHYTRFFFFEGIPYLTNFLLQKLFFVPDILMGIGKTFKMASVASVEKKLQTLEKNV